MSAPRYRNYSARARAIARALDAAVLPAAPLLRRVAPAGRPPGTTPGSILVVRLDHLGDVLMSTPAIAALRRAFPSARLDVLAAPWGAAALRGNPDVDRVLPGAAAWYDPTSAALSGLGAVLRAARALRREPYDWGFDLRGDPRVVLFYLLPAARRRFGFAGLGLEDLLTDAVPYERRRGMLDGSLDLVALAGVSPGSRRPVFAVTEEDRAEAARLLGAAGAWTGRRVAVIAPGSNRREARWPARGFARVADALGADFAVVLVGRDADAPVTREVAVAAARVRPADLTGATGLGTLAAVLERASVLVTNDSGPSHLAAAVDCPTVAVFGPSDPELTFPYADGHRFVAVTRAIDHPRPCFDPACPSDHGFSAIDPEQVAALAVRAAGRAGVA